MAAVANPPASSAGYVWEDPGDSIMIQVSLEVVERLRIGVQQGLGAGARGNEIGGILLGRRLPGYGQAVVIEDFEPLPSEHLRGASYSLSPRDRRVLGSRLARRSGRQVVGYFRSHTRPGMYLDQDDFAVFSQFFPEAWQVFLLVRPSNDGPATGGFFFWEDGDVNRRSTYRQFPFDSSALVAGGFPITGGSPGPHAVAVLAAARPVAVVEPKKAATRKERRLPSLPWVVVPAIAVLFLIAGFFASEKEPATHEMAAVKTTSPPVEPLLPEPSPQAAAAPAPPVEAAQPSPVEGVPADVSAATSPQPIVAKKPVRTPKKTPVSLAPAAKPAPRAPVHEVEAPPVLSAQVRLEEKNPPPLPLHPNAAPAPEATVSYEAARAGVLRRALHKFEGTDASEYAPASPVRTVSPVRPRNVTEARLVDVKVSIDDTGRVTRAQLVGKNSDLAAVAVAAAREWQFRPARKHDRAVSSEMVLHFQF